MTHRGLRRVEDDGTHVYADYHRYTPVSLAERKYAVRKPEHPEAVRFHGDWFLPLELVDEQERDMPDTRPDEEAEEHKMLCRCLVCRRPGAIERKRRALRRAS